MTDEFQTDLTPGLQPDLQPSLAVAVSLLEALARKHGSQSLLDALVPLRAALTGNVWVIDCDPGADEVHDTGEDAWSLGLNRSVYATFALAQAHADKEINDLSKEWIKDEILPADFSPRWEPSDEDGVIQCVMGDMTYYIRSIAMTVDNPSASA